MIDVIILSILFLIILGFIGYWLAIAAGVFSMIKRGREHQKYIDSLVDKYRPDGPNDPNSKKL